MLLAMNKSLFFIFLAVTGTAGKIFSRYKDKEKVKLKQKDVDISDLESRFNCPITKRPWQYRPFGCHNKHLHLKDNHRFKEIQWFDRDSIECNFYDICMRSCKSPNSDQNLCFNTTTDQIQHGIGCNCKCSYYCIKNLSKLYEESGDSSEKRIALLNVEGRFITLTGDIVDEQFNSIVDDPENDPLFHDQMPDKIEDHPNIGIQGHYDESLETKDMFSARSATHGQEIIKHNAIASDFLEEFLPEGIDNYANNNDQDSIAYSWLQEAQTQANPIADDEEHATIDAIKARMFIPAEPIATSIVSSTEPPFVFVPSVDHQGCTTWPENVPEGLDRQELINNHTFSQVLNFIPKTEDLDLCFSNNWCSGDLFPCKDFVCSRRCRECFSRCYNYQTSYTGPNLNCACQRGIEILIQKETDQSENNLKLQMLKIAMTACPHPDQIMEKASTVDDVCPHPTNRIGQWKGQSLFQADQEKMHSLIQHYAGHGVDLMEN